MSLRRSTHLNTSSSCTGMAAVMHTVHAVHNGSFHHSDQEHASRLEDFEPMQAQGTFVLKTVA